MLPSLHPVSRDTSEKVMPKGTALQSLFLLCFGNTNGARGFCPSLREYMGLCPKPRLVPFLRKRY